MQIIYWIKHSKYKYLYYRDDAANGSRTHTLIKSNQVIIIMLYVYVYVVYFVMYDSVLILLLSYGHHYWFNKVFTIHSFISQHMLHLLCVCVRHKNQ
jgi:hypothetical protein